FSNCVVMLTVIKLPGGVHLAATSLVQTAFCPRFATRKFSSFECATVQRIVFWFVNAGSGCEPTINVCISSVRYRYTLSIGHGHFKCPPGPRIAGARCPKCYSNA